MLHINVSHEAYGCHHRLVHSQQMQEICLFLSFCTLPMQGLLANLCSLEDHSSLFLCLPIFSQHLTLHTLLNALHTVCTQWHPRESTAGPLSIAVNWKPTLYVDSNREWACCARQLQNTELIHVAMSTSLAALLTVDFTQVSLVI